MGSGSRLTADLDRVFHLDAIEDFHVSRTASIHALLAPGAPTESNATPRAYALAHHFLEGAEAAAREHHVEVFDWYTAAVGRELVELLVDTPIGPVVVVWLRRGQLIRSAVSETPYYRIDSEARPVDPPRQRLVAQAFAHGDACGFRTLLNRHAAVVCLLFHRNLDDTLHSWSITRLPGTVFTDFTDEAAVLGRDLVHEAGHHWLNDALAVSGSTIPSEVTFLSPWRRTMRPAFGFLHACWAFPLTMIYCARLLPELQGSVRNFLVAYLRQQEHLLAAANDDFHRAVELVVDDGLRDRLVDVFHAARRPDARAER